MTLQLPSREDIDRQTVSEQGYSSLLAVGIKTLNPQSPWASNTLDAGLKVDYGYTIEAGHLSMKLIIAADLLYRAHEMDPSRRGLVLEERKDMKRGTRTLRSTLINPEISRNYELWKDWTTLPIHRTDPIVQKEKSFIIRKLGLDPATKITITRLKRIRNEASKGADFAILSALQLGNELFLRVENAQRVCFNRKVIQVSEVHTDIDGMMIVKSVSEKEIVTVPPLALHQTSTPDRRSFSDLTNASGCVVASVDDRCCLYHLALLDNYERPLINSGPSSTPTHHEDDVLNPFLRIETEATPVTSAMDPPLDTPLTHDDAQYAFAMKCVQSSELRSRFISFCFDQSKVESSLWALLRKFGIEKISTNFNEALSNVSNANSRRSFNIELAPYIKRMDHLIETPYQHSILKKVETGQNWLFIMPLCHIKIATYLHLIKCLFQIQPRSKVLVLVESWTCAERLDNIITEVTQKFGLDQVKVKPLSLHERRRESERQQPLQSLIAVRNVIITTTEFAEYLFSSELFRIDLFAMIVWDQCEHIMTDDPGHKIIARYQSMQQQGHKLPKIYAFSSQISKKEEDDFLFRMKQMCDMLCIPTGNFCHHETSKLKE